MARISFRDLEAEFESRIARRVWQPGATIPGEEALAAEFGVARATVNRALQELARAGLVERRRKAGTRVAVHPVREARLLIPVVRKEIEARGMDYGYVLLSRQRLPAPEAVRARLGLAGASPMLHLRCLHLADRVPYQVEDRWISLGTVPAAADESFAEIGPNEWLVANAPFSRAEFSFRAARAGGDDSELLQIARDEAVFVAERVTWLGERPVTWVRMTHPPGYRLMTEI